MPVSLKPKLPESAVAMVEEFYSLFREFDYDVVMAVARDFDNEYPARTRAVDDDSAPQGSYQARDFEPGPGGHAA